MVCTFCTAAIKEIEDMSLHSFTLEVNAWGEVGAGNITSNDEVSFLLPCGSEDEAAMVDAKTHS